IPLPAGAASAGSLWASAKNAALFGSFETSIGEVRYVDDATGMSLREIQEFTRTAGPNTIVVCEDVVPTNDWFIVWPIARYYLPAQNIWVISSQAESGTARMVRRSEMSDVISGASLRLRVPKPSRILWLMERGGRLHQALEKVVSLQGGPHVFYTD